VERSAAHAHGMGLSMRVSNSMRPHQGSGWPVPVVQTIADLLGNRCLAGDACDLLLVPGLERRYQRLALVLAHPVPVVSAHTPDHLLDRIEGGDPLKRFAAIGASPPLAMSKNRRRRCVQQKASVMASPGAAAIFL
jgi:hypothetical protein